MTSLKSTARTALMFLVLGGPCPAVHLNPATNRQFDDYVAAAEQRLQRQHASPDTYMASLDTAQRDSTEADLRSGAVSVEPIHGGSWPVSGGLLHHWRGAAFVPGASREQMLKLLQDYNHLSTYYQPEVVSSRLVSESGGSATVAMRLRKQLAIPVVFDAQYLVETGLSGRDCGYGTSRSLHMWQVDAPGTPHERRLTEGDDDGLLWRINAYWSFRQVAGGLFIECEAVSLTRDIPAGLGWLVTPIVRELPKTSLESTLIATRTALETQGRGEQKP